MSALAGLEVGPIGVPEYWAVSGWLLAAGLGCVILRRDATAVRVGSVLILQAVTLALVGLGRFAPAWLAAPMGAPAVISAVSIAWGILLAGIAFRWSETRVPAPMEPSDGRPLA